MRLLIVEDNFETIDLIKFSLQELDFQFIFAQTGKKALELAEEFLPKIIILDLQLEGDLSGNDICKIIKENPEKYKNPFIIIVSSTCNQEIINENFKNGSDDYIVKPFDYEELFWRINKLKKFSTLNDYENNNILMYKNITIHKEMNLVYVDNKRVLLGKHEYLLLSYLIENKGKIKTRSQILDFVWQDDFDVSEHAVNQCLKRLKKKINLFENSLINMRGLGYGLE